VSTAIVNYDYEGRTFTDEECVGVLLTAIGGAIETTVSAIGFAVYLLGQFPEERRKLIDHPELVLSAVEEVLRMNSPVNASARTLKKPFEVEGVTLPAGDRVLLLVDSANYDDTVFEDPQQFRIDRPNNPHLTFGHGIHKCEGQHLARLELRVVIEELVRRLPEYEVVGTPVVEFGQVVMPTNIHITFPPGQREPLT
jgi:cytochrome P450